MGESNEKLDKAGPSSVFGSRAGYVVISRRSILLIFVVSVGGLGGALLAERIRLQHNSSKLKHGKVVMKDTNKRLRAEKDEYQGLSKKLTNHLEQLKAGHDYSAEEHKTQMESFKDSSEALMAGLEDVLGVLEEKEFRLWEKEGLLDYQEERLLDSEDQEVQMALYINLLAQQMLALNLSLPEGLEEQPYYGQQRAHSAEADDDMLKDERRSDKIFRTRHRQLQGAMAHLRSNHITGAYRQHLLHQEHRTG